MGEPWYTTGNAYMLSLLEVGRRAAWVCQNSMCGTRFVLMDQYRSRPWLPPGWPVIDGDVLEIQRLGRTRIRVTVLEGEQRLDSLRWLRRRWYDLATSGSGGHTA